MSAGAVEVAVVRENLCGGAHAGFQALNELQTSFPVVRVVVLLKSAPRDLVVDAFRAGAEGVVCRTEPIRVLRRAFRLCTNDRSGPTATSSISFCKLR